MVKVFYIVLFFIIGQTAFAERKSLEEDIADGYLDDYSKIEAAFILSGVTHPDSLQRYLNWYDQLLTKIKSFSFDSNDPIGSAQTVFIYLHNSQLFMNKNYMDAFMVFADGYYRYPDNEDFLKNTLASFFNALQTNWQKKGWQGSARLIDEVKALAILQKQDHNHIKQILNNWLHYFNIIKKTQLSNEVKGYLEIF